MNVLDFMLQIEQDGLHLYETLAMETSSAERKEIFELLADAQRRHLATLNSLKESVRSADVESTAAERARHLPNGFRRLLESHDILAELKKDPDAFEHVVKAEEENIRLLQGMAAAEPHLPARTILEKFVAEEEQHLAKIENIYDFIEAPHTFLEWGEFTNLRPL
jgi:rubrerythrin